MEENKIFKILFRSGGSININEAYNLVTEVLPDMSKKEIVDTFLKVHERVKTRYLVQVLFFFCKLSSFLL